MKRDTSRTLIAAVFFVALSLLSLNPAAAVADCDLVCTGVYVIDDIDTDDDLDALAGCTTVIGRLYIENTTLTNLEGLECLNYVVGGLFIRYNDSLINLTGLENLESIGGGDSELMISDNDSLINLTGLENLESSGYLSFRGNDSLINLTGLENLESIGYLIISDNPSLTSLVGLQGLESVDENLEIEDNALLTSLGLENLESVGGNFWIRNNDELCTDLAVDLANQVTIGGTTDISGNKDCTP
jgi:hypothetical protein